MSLHEREWPGDVIGHMSDGIIATAKTIRDTSGVPLTPSPVPEAHVRFEDGTSRHAIGSDGSRKSDATDLYLVRNTDAARLWLYAQRCVMVGGFGIYFDTELNGEKRVLVHLDNRPERLLWVCPSRNRATERREYIYFRETNPGVYLDILSAELARL